MSVRKQLLESFLKKKGSTDFWVNLALFGILGLTFWPITYWFVATANDQSRLVNALAVLALAMVALVRFGGVEIRGTLQLNASARRALYASFALLILQFIGAQLAPGKWNGLISLLVIPAYCCGLAAFVRFVFGEETRRLTLTAASTLCAFLLLSILMQPLDWPLRALAGKWSASALELIGKSVELGLAGAQSGPPKLILLVNEHPFHVASECNGFGVILTSILIGLLLALYRRVGLFDTGLNLIVGLVFGFAFNILRIVVIVLLAPHMMEQYQIMHEIVGTITYWACLLIVWVLLNGPTKEAAAKDEPNTSQA